METGRYTNPSATIVDPTLAELQVLTLILFRFLRSPQFQELSKGSPTRSVDVSDFKIVSTKLDPSSDSTLYTRLPKTDIESIDFTNASLTIRKVISVDIANGQLSSNVIASQNESFLPFDEERYA